MAINVTPTEMWTGYTSDGSNITIPISSLTGLTAAEANQTTGDFREIMLAFLYTAYLHLSGLAAADTPTTYVMKLPSTATQYSGDLAGTTKTTFVSDFYLDLALTDIADEPA